jgi:serine/threonine protein kinase/tetratricopeptide (TPR) repeat protein
MQDGMNLKRRQQIEKLFQSAIERPADEREAFLDQACASDTHLRSQVDSLIASHDRPRAVIKSPTVDLPTIDMSSTTPVNSQSEQNICPEIGPYRVISHIGRGGMGEVYLAQDTRLGRQVALKMLRAELTRDADRLRRFQQEARAASALNHPNILTVYDIGQADTIHFIATEYVEGETLRECIATSKMAVRHILDVAIQVANALSAAHQAGIVHRDIKPENIMLRPDGYIKVLDFGIAKFAETLHRQPLTDLEAATVELVNTEPGVVIGSPTYMSPEQARGLKVDTRTDIFSLGVVLYEMITGSPPFVGTTISDVLVSVLTAEPLPLNRYSREIPEQLQQIVSKALAKERGERFQAMTDLALDLKSLQQEQEYNSRLESSGKTESERDVRRIVSPRIRHTVGRRRERAQMDLGFKSAATGRGLLMCVSGEPGIGKTTLVEDFLTDLAAQGKPFNVARGRCSERLAGTEAYLPFLEAFDGMLKDEAVDAASPVMKIVAPTWYLQVAPLSADNTGETRLMGDMRNASQERMKRELIAFLQEMSRQQPLVLFFDDLHWADVSTIDLLAYLATKFDSMRLLIVATYRPSDLLLAKHPFLQVKLDLQGRGLCQDIELEFLSSEDIEQYLDLEFSEHRFPVELTALIHTKTEGNPLFMVDLVRYLRDRNVIAQDQGKWALMQSVNDIERGLPESIRSMIEKKIDQLSEQDRRLLVAASVQGYEFDSAVVWKALELDPAHVEERLDLLERVFVFVRLISEEELPDGTPTLRYRFVHALYQNALYASIGPTRRASLSKAVAEALLGYYKQQSSEVASGLAHLLEIARDFERATDFFLLAAQRAADVFAHDEAAALARRGLKLLEILSDSPDHTQKELLLQLIVGFSLSITKGSATPEMGESMNRAREICEQIGDSPQLFPVIWGLWAYYLVGAELQEARHMAEKTLRLAQNVKDPVLLVGAHYAIGTSLQFLGELASGHEHLERAIALDDPQQHRSYSLLYKLNPRLYSQSETVYTLWQLGYPEQSRRRLDETLTLAQQDRDPRSLAQALWFAAYVHQLCRDAQKTQEYAETCITHCNEHGIAQERDWVATQLGWAMAEQGLVQAGIAQMRESLSTLRAKRAHLAFTFSVTLLVEALIKDSQIEEGITVVAEALDLVRRTSQRTHEAELYRLKGELMIMQAEGSATLLSEAESCFHQAIGIARAQTAKSFELRAVMSLSRLYEKHGKKEEARQVLSEIYDWFTEGFNTADLKEAKMLLEGMAA